jgi:YmdB-like protein
MNILFIGDIVGRPGRELIRKGLRGLIDHHGVDFTIANAENAAAGFGVTKDIGDALLDWGVDVMTSGNHIFDKREVIPYITSQPCRRSGSGLVSRADGRWSRRGHRQRHGTRVHDADRRSFRGGPHRD